MDVEVVGGAVRGDGHAVPGQQRVVVDDRNAGRREADLMAEQGRAGLGPAEVTSVAGAQGRGGDGLAGPADRVAMLGDRAEPTDRICLDGKTLSLSGSASESAGTVSAPQACPRRPSSLTSGR